MEYLRICDTMAGNTRRKAKKTSAGENEETMREQMQKPGNSWRQQNSQSVGRC